MSDIAEKLLAAIGAKEAKARAATSGPWRHDPNKHWRKRGTAWFEEAVFAGPSGQVAICVAGTGQTDDPRSMADAAFIADNDPDGVLLGCAADREIVDHFRNLVAKYKHLKSLDYLLDDQVQELGTLAARIADFAAVILPARARGYGVTP